MAKQIPLTQGKFATVDDGDYEWAMQWKWCAKWDGWNWYAMRFTPRPNRKTIYLHREIVKAPPGVQVDHEDGDGLNDRKGNLRPATHAENGRNRKINANNTSGYKGVTWNKGMGKWKVYIRTGGTTIHLGYFNDIADAALAYDVAAKERFGKFARPNFPEGEQQ